MPVGMILLLAVAALVYFGFAHRVLDRLRLTDTQALIVIALMVAGSFIDIPVYRDSVDVSVNAGGALIPLALVVYLLVRADTGRERVRALLAAVVVAAVVWGIAQFTDFDPGTAALLDPLWLFSIVAGVVGYLVGGRSRRSAFIGGTLGILLTDAVHLVTALRQGLPATVAWGGAGVFDTVVIAGVIAVALAELIGESRERLQGGPSHEMRDGVRAGTDGSVSELSGEGSSGETVRNAPDDNTSEKGREGDA